MEERSGISADIVLDEEGERNGNASHDEVGKTKRWPTRQNLLVYLRDGQRYLLNVTASSLRSFPFLEVF